MSKRCSRAPRTTRPKTDRHAGAGAVTAFARCFGGWLLLLAADREELGDLPGDVVGVGPVVAAANAARLIAERQPRRVVLMGTAGSYPGGPGIGSVVVSGTLGLSWGIASLGLGYVPRAPEPLSGDRSMITQSKLPPHDVLTVGAVTTDLDLAARLGGEWTVEHLEAYAVAYACAHASIPFVAVFGITNDVGPEAHVQWLTHREQAQSKAREAVQALLQES